MLYLKIEQSIEVAENKVRLGDVAKLECTKPGVVNRLKTEQICVLPQGKNSRKILSVLYVVRKIHEIYPELEVQNLGETDFVVSYRPKKESVLWKNLKIVFVCAVSFFGSMFAMMTFNEDVSTKESFAKVYTWVTGTEPVGVTILEITYSIGVSVGIIVFFNHLGKKYLTKEPSPVEIEMAEYEQKINEMLIKQAGRNGQELDVD